jgi:hypothetical protein
VERTTHSKTLEYSSFFALVICTITRRQPSGNTTRESANDPEKEREQMADEQRPPKMTICQSPYRGGLRINRSSEADADDTDISSYMTCRKRGFSVNGERKEI